MFGRFTIHRGVSHSLLATLFFRLLATVVSHHWFGMSRLMSWSTGFFVFFGYVLHLALDELFGVDLLSTRVKRSFGTALELVSYGN